MNDLFPDNQLEEQIAEQWNRNALFRLQELSSGVDRTYHDILCPILAAQLMRFSPGPLVVDAGCGLGFFSNYIAERGFEVVGIDMSKTSIALAKRSFPHLHFVRDTISHFSSCHQGYYSACVVNMLLHNVVNLDLVTQSLFRLLGSNGVLVGCIPHPANWFSNRKRQSQSVSVRGQKAYLAPFRIRGLQPHPEPFTYFDRTADDYWDSLRRAGFSHVEAVNLDDFPYVPDDLIFFIATRT